MNLITNNTNTKPIIIAVDHGYGQIKAAHAVFKTGVTAYDKEPIFKSNMLVYQDRYYIIGDEHKEFTAEKMNDQDYYILTLAAIGIELRLRGLDSARVHLAVGLPLTWVTGKRGLPTIPIWKRGRRRMPFYRRFLKLSSVAHRPIRWLASPRCCRLPRQCRTTQQSKTI